MLKWIIQCLTLTCALWQAYSRCWFPSHVARSCQRAVQPPNPTSPTTSSLTVWGSAHSGSTTAKPLVSTLFAGLSLCQKPPKAWSGQFYWSITHKYTKFTISISVWHAEILRTLGATNTSCSSFLFKLWQISLSKFSSLTVH